MRKCRGIVASLLLASMLAPLGARASHQPVNLDDGPTGGPVLGALPPDAPDGVLFDWSVASDGVAGGVTYGEHEIVLTDHPFDDHGANIDGDDGISGNPAENYEMLHGAGAAGGAAGDYLYPSDPELVGNAADIIEVRLGLDTDAWYVLVQLNALLEPEKTGIEITLHDPNTDGPPTTLLMHGDTALLGEVPVELVPDALQNTFEARIPFEVFEPADDMDVVVSAGVWDGDGWHHPAPGTQALPAFDLALTVSEGPASYWADRAQSAMLAGIYPVDPWRVDFEGLRCTGPCPRFIVRRGPRAPFVRVFRSAQDLGEGVVPQTRYSQSDSFDYRLYRSPYQPYSVYVPLGAEHGPAPVLFLLHFLGGNHRSFGITSWGREMKEWADRLDAIIVTPLARGEAGWYEGEAEIDVFEVWRDLARQYNLDVERIYLTGMSMGGYGTWRLGQLYPDLFARAIAWSGPPTPYSIWAAPTPVMYPHQNPPACDRDAEGCGLTLMDLIGNASNLPYLVVHGGADELVPAAGIEGWMGDYAASELPHRYVFYPGRRHETSFPGTTGHHVLSWLYDLPTRVTDPAEVRYRIVRDFFQPDFGIAYDGAYWLNDMLLAADASQGEAHAVVSSTFSQATGPLFGLDSLGPYRMTGIERAPGAPSGPVLFMEITGLASLSLDAARLGWAPEDSLGLNIDTDRAATLTLVGSFAPDVEVVGTPFEVIDGDIVLTLSPGENGIQISPF